MTDENKDRDAGSASLHELAETPFGGFKPGSVEETEIAENQPEQPVVVEESEPSDSEEPPVEEILAEAEEESPNEQTEKEPEMSMEEALDAYPPGESKSGGSVDYSQTFRTLSVGDVVPGTVVHIDKEGVLVDVGTKSEGVIRMPELARESFQDPEEIVQVGQTISVYVMNSETEDGNLLLSKKRADFEEAWNRVEEAYKEGKIINAMVNDRVKGGLVVDLGIRGFVPGSQVGSGKVKNLDKYVGQSIPLKVIEVDRERRKVVLSHKLAVEEELERQRSATLENLAEGQIRTGVVRRLTDYGAFIDLGGIDGLLHVSEMSWTRINHPSEVLKAGQKIQVMVLKLNLDQGKVSLGLRQILPDPWREITNYVHQGDVIKGKVTRLVPFGAFVQVEGGVEGIIPVSELATRRVNKPEDVVEVGQEVEVKVIDLRPDERRMTLSIRQLQLEREPREPREPKEPREFSGFVQQPSPKTTVADLIGEAMTRAAKRRKSEVDEEDEEPEIIPAKPAKSRGKGGSKRIREEELLEEDLSDLEAEVIEETEPEAKEEIEATTIESDKDEPLVTLGDLVAEKIAVAEEKPSEESSAPEAEAVEELVQEESEPEEAAEVEKPEES